MKGRRVKVSNGTPPRLREVTTPYQVEKYLDEPMTTEEAVMILANQQSEVWASLAEAHSGLKKVWMMLCILSLFNGILWLWFV